MATGDRVRTFIQGFDEKLGGGIPERSIVLLCGEPGTMKSTLAFNVLYHNAMRESRNGVFVTLEQSRDGLSHHLRQMALDPKDVEDHVSIVDLGMIRKNLTSTQDSWFEIFRMYASNLKRTLGFDLLVIEWIRDLDATVFMVQELSTPQDAYGRHGEEFLADGIIAVKMQAVDDANIQRRIRCVKLRSTAHSPNFYTLIYQNGLFQVTRVLGD